MLNSPDVETVFMRTPSEIVNNLGQNALFEKIASQILSGWTNLQTVKLKLLDALKVARFTKPNLPRRSSNSLHT